MWLAIADCIVLEKFSLKIHSCKVFFSCCVYDYGSVACYRLLFPIVADVTEFDVASGCTMGLSVAFEDFVLI